VFEQIRALVAANAGLRSPAEGLAGDANLFDAGLDTEGFIRLLLALEDAFDVHFPERSLSPANFETLDAIALTLVEAGAAKLRGLLDGQGKGISRAA
jgi:acyl carrier protein